MLKLLFTYIIPIAKMIDCIGFELSAKSWSTSYYNTFKMLFDIGSL